MNSYNYPSQILDFTDNKPLMFESMRLLEQKLRKDLLSDNPATVKSALANVVYWGFASTPLADVRSRKFLNEVTEGQIEKTIRLFSGISGNSLNEIKLLGLPQFSQMSFTSKLRMFLDPANYVVLDSQLLKLKDAKTKTLFRGIQRYPTSIPISRLNCQQYDKWCSLCKNTANYLQGAKAVDVERGIFHLVNNNKLEEAANIVYSIEN